MTDERTSYRERTPWPGWVNAIFWGAIIVSCYPLLAGWDNQLSFLVCVVVVCGIIGAALGLRTVVGGLTVMVQETRIYLHLGSIRLIKRTVPFVDIVALDSVDYRPIREFGGWGVRGWGKKKAWTARGDRAVRLELVGDRVLYIGSDHPQRLEERIRAVAGDQL